MRAELRPIERANVAASPSGRRYSQTPVPASGYASSAIAGTGMTSTSYARRFDVVAPVNSSPRRPIATPPRIATVKGSRSTFASAFSPEPTGPPADLVAVTVLGTASVDGGGITESTHAINRCVDSSDHLHRATVSMLLRPTSFLSCVVYASSTMLLLLSDPTITTSASGAPCFSIHSASSSQLVRPSTLA